MHITDLRIMGSSNDTDFSIGIIETGLDLLITRKQLRRLSDDDLLAIKHWFEKHADELTTLESVREYGEYYCSFTDLVLVHGITTDAWIKSQAAQVLDRLLEDDQRQSKRQPVELNNESEDDGWIYVVGSREMGLYKIGLTTRTPDERLLEFTPKLPFPTTLVCAIKSHDVVTDEIVFHDAFDDKRTNGEWFELDSEDLDWLKVHARTSGGTVNE